MAHQRNAPYIESAYGVIDDLGGGALSKAVRTFLRVHDAWVRRVVTRSQAGSSCFPWKARFSSSPASWAASGPTNRTDRFCITHRSHPYASTLLGVPPIRMVLVHVIDLAAEPSRACLRPLPRTSAKTLQYTQLEQERASQEPEADHADEPESHANEDDVSARQPDTVKERLHHSPLCEKAHCQGQRHQATETPEHNGANFVGCDERGKSSDLEPYEQQRDRHDRRQDTDLVYSNAHDGTVAVGAEPIEFAPGRRF